MKSVKPSAPQTSLLTKLRSAASDKLELLAEGVGLVFAVSGATIAAVLGKVIVGVALGVLALGFLFRLKGRKKRALEAKNLVESPGVGARLLTGVVSACEVAALVEATNLPVRFDQTAFHMGHWYLVLLVFFAAYFLQLPLFARLLCKFTARSAA